MAKQSNPYLRGATRRAPFLAIGHRGAQGLAPENTLAGFQLAIDLGVDMVELDVALSRDGIPVVVHDSHLTRTTDAKVRFPDRDPWDVLDFDAAELATLDASHWFTVSPPWKDPLTPEERERFLTPVSMARFTVGEHPVPSLEVVLDLVAGAGVDADLELKAIPRRVPGLVERVLEVIRAGGYEHRVLISSFDHDLLRAVKGAAPDIATGVLTSERLAEPTRYLIDLVGADVLLPCATRAHDCFGATPPHRGELDDLAARVEAIHRAGLMVLPWTVDRPEDIQRLRSAGVDGIIADFPNRLL
jgi:glycerophosphoryl diester phosphodiesterase